MNIRSYRDRFLLSPLEDARLLFFEECLLIGNRIVE